MKHLRIVLVSLLTLFISDIARAQVVLRTEFFFPQIADGKIDDDDELRTIVVLNNPSGSTATGTLSIFGDDGSPLAMRFRTFDGQTLQGTSIPFTIPPMGLFQAITARSESSMSVGYGKVNSSIPIGGMAIFGEFEVEEDDDEFEVEIESQAAVEATGKMRAFAITDFRRNKFERRIGGIEFKFESETSTGLAVVNTGAVSTTLTLKAFDSSGQQIGQSQMVLGPGAHRAFFLRQVLNVPSSVGIGSVTVESSATDISAVALKFDDEDDEDEFTVAPVIQISP